MNPDHIAAILAITALSFSAAAMAEKMTKSEYIAAGKEIAAEYRANRRSCASFAHEYRDSCMAEARLAAKTEKADLDAAYKTPAKAGKDVNRRLTPFPNKSVMS